MREKNRRQEGGEGLGDERDYEGREKKTEIEKR